MAKDIFKFQIISGGELSNPKFDETNILKWDELGIDVKFDFIEPLNVSVGEAPDKVIANIDKDSFSYFISDNNKDIALDEEISLIIDIPN